MIFFIFTTLLKSNKNKNNQRKFYNSNIVRIFDTHKFIQNFLHVFFKEDLIENRLDQHKLTLKQTSSYLSRNKTSIKQKNHPVNEMIFFIFTTLLRSNKNKNNQRKFHNSNIERIFDIHKFIRLFLLFFLLGMLYDTQARFKQ